MSPDPMPLEYAPPPPVYRRGWFWRAMAAGVIVLVLGGVWWWRQELLLHARLLYWQRQCLTYAVPPGRVVYETDAQAGDQLLSQSSGYVRGAGGWRAAVFRPAEPWARLYALLSPPGQRTMPAAFVHERRSPDGHRWLVAVQLYEDGLGVRLAFLDVDVVRPGRGWERPRLWHSSLDRAVLIDAARVYAGQPDPEDPTHFTIEYDDQAGQRRVLDGWVKERGRIAIEPRRME